MSKRCTVNHAGGAPCPFDDEKPVAPPVAAMTREEIDQTLAMLARYANDKRQWSDGDPVDALVEIVTDQERRLRVLEPCSSPVRGFLHVWTKAGTGLVCEGCNLTRDR